MPDLTRRELLRAALASGVAAALAPRRVAAAEGAPLFSFAVVADPHLSENDHQNPGTGLAKFGLVSSKIDAMPEDRRPDFALICGDLHVHKLEAALSTLPIPAHVTPGNHESRKARAQLRKMLPKDFQGRDFYSFMHKGAKFISLCTAIPGDHVGHVSSEGITPKTGQCEWLEKELADDAARTFVFGHIPPHPEGKDVNMFLGQNDSRFMIGLIEKHQPTALFFGHQHRRRRFSIGKSQVFVVRSANWNGGGREPTGFLMVRVLEAGIDVEFVETGPANPLKK